MSAAKTRLDVLQSVPAVEASEELIQRAVERIDRKVVGRQQFRRYFFRTLAAVTAASVLIIGGFTSIAGAIVGGLLIGATEKLAELYVGEWIGVQGIENWFPYMLALVFLLFRPNGLFGEKTIARV